MAKMREIVEKIIMGLTKLQNAAGPPVDLDDDFPLLRMIPVGDGNHIASTKKIDQLIDSVAKGLLEQDGNLATRFSQKELDTTVRNGFGAALSQIDLDDDLPRNAEIVLAKVKGSLNARVSSAGFREYCFGCTLFGNQDVAPLEIGPARFEPRTKWLTRKFSDGAISKVTRRRISRAWQGQKLSKRKNSRDNIQERETLNTIGSCPYVCSVSTDGFMSEAGKERALTAARLAMTSIALLLPAPSNALRGFNLSFDRQLHQRLALAFSPARLIYAGGSISQLPHGPSLKTGEWEQVFVKHARHFDVSGEVLDYVVSPDGNVARPKLMNALTQSFLWFHEACRETVTLMGIVKFAASMEALALGRKESGIRSVINARLGIQDDAKVFSDGLTMKQVIGEIYRYGRSRTMHGTNEKLGYDWSVTRGRAEQFASLCLLGCIDHAGKDRTNDDPAQFAV